MCNVSTMNIFKCKFHIALYPIILYVSRLTARKSISRMTKWRHMDSTTAPMSQRFHQGRITASDWFSDMLQTAHSYTQRSPCTDTSPAILDRTKFIHVILILKSYIDVSMQIRKNPNKNKIVYKEGNIHQT